MIKYELLCYWSCKAKDYMKYLQKSLLNWQILWNRVIKIEYRFWHWLFKQNLSLGIVFAIQTVRLGFTTLVCWKSILWEVSWPHDLVIDMQSWINCSLPDGLPTQAIAVRYFLLFWVQNIPRELSSLYFPSWKSMWYGLFVSLQIPISGTRNSD